MPLAGVRTRVAAPIAGALVALLCAADAVSAEASLDANPEQLPAPTGDVRTCPGGNATTVMLDIPGPGQPTPELAAAPYAGGGVSLVVVTEVETTAVVHALTRDEQVARVFRLTKRPDGWWPDGYSACLSQWRPS